MVRIEELSEANILKGDQLFTTLLDGLRLRKGKTTDAKKLDFCQDILLSLHQNFIVLLFLFYHKLRQCKEIFSGQKTLSDACIGC